MPHLGGHLHTALRNQFLRCLSSQSRDAILSQCTKLELPVGTSLYKPEESIRYAYFLTSGMASVVVPMANGESAEVALIGKEGLTGSMQVIGPAAIPTACFIQLAATGFRIRSSRLESLFHTSDEIHSRMLEFIQQEAFTFSQIAGCSRLHDAHSRLARWLLMAGDRTDSPILNFTHEFLGEMLGLQRTTVNAAAGALYNAGLIDHERGKIVVTNRRGLEDRACGCYRIAHQLFHGLYAKPWSDRLSTHCPKRLD